MSAHDPAHAGVSHTHGHSHAHGHGHGHGAGSPRTALLFSITANGALLVVQVIVGLLIGSLALLADSLHNASDVVALVIALVGQGLAARPATSKRTYGLARAEIIAALINAAVLMALTGWVVVEAIGRFSDPQELEPGPLALIGVVGIVVNGGSAWYLARSGGSSLNLRAAYWHLVADALGSVGVLLAAIGVVLFDATWADPAASIVISVLIVVGVWRLLRDTVEVLLESTPPGIDPAAVAGDLAAQPGVEEVHHLHIWSLDSQTPALTAHLRIADGLDLHDAQQLADRSRALLHDRYGIDHVTLESECHDCPAPDHLIGEATGTSTP
jgi:cobalt-zinc-cadmium efflux system protein